MFVTSKYGKTKKIQFSSDLCRRFMNRNLFKYVEFTDKHGLDNWMELVSLLKRLD